jgi:predicted acylesterase/phospholipase RssA
MNWKQIGRFLRTVVLLRVPLAALLLLATVGPVALFRLEKLLGNLFDVRVPPFNPMPEGPAIDVFRTASHLFLVSFAAFMLAWTAVAVINLVVIYGGARFEDRALSLQQKRPLLTFLCGLGAASVLVVCAVMQTRFEGGYWALRYLTPVLGLVSSLIVVVLAKVVQLALTDPVNTPHPPPYLVFPAYILPGLERWFDALYCWRSGKMDKLKGSFNRISQWPLEILRCAGQGYLIRCDAHPGKLALQSGHVFALASSLLSLSLYLIIGFAKSRIDNSPAKVPALAFVLLFFIVACWGLSALTFFFDRYRFPLLACIVLLSVATTFAPESDHIYRVEVGQDPQRAKMMRPSELVREYNRRGRTRLVLVATAGGGIQAAAWTATVLRGLEQACQDSSLKDKCDPRQNIILISGVSGGSVGAMAYARSFTSVPSAVDEADVPRKTKTSAIDEVAWGWTVPDVFRALLPGVLTSYVDRGWALEEKWSWINQLHYILPNGRRDNSKKDTFLADWAPASGRPVPGLLLNATIVEPGRPLVFSNTAFPCPNDSRGLKNFYDLYPDLKQPYDIRVNTAARISASFPYVAPAARSNAVTAAVPDYHMVDGGYYDNFGVSSLLGWLEDAIEDPGPCDDGQSASQAGSRKTAGSEGGAKSDLADVLIVEIRPFPPPKQKSGSVHGWGYQVTAPVDGILDVRDNGQLVHDDRELALFTRNYQKEHVNIWRADFVFPNNFLASDKGCAEAPLSWKLSLDQMKCVDTGWEYLQQGKTSSEVNCVVNYLRGKPVKSYEPGKSDPNVAYCRTGDNSNVEGAQ